MSFLCDIDGLGDRLKWREAGLKRIMIYAQVGGRGGEPDVLQGLHEPYSGVQIGRAHV